MTTPRASISAVRLVAVLWIFSAGCYGEWPRGTPLEAGADADPSVSGGADAGPLRDGTGPGERSDAPGDTNPATLDAVPTPGDGPLAPPEAGLDSAVDGPWDGPAAVQDGPVVLVDGPGTFADAADAARDGEFVFDASPDACICPVSTDPCAENTCIEGKCQSRPKPGSLTDPKNCGACGKDCSKLKNVKAGSPVECRGGVCLIPPSSCEPGFGHCSLEPDDGCEADLSRPQTCGSCTNICSGSLPACELSGSNGRCVPICAGDRPDRCGTMCTSFADDSSNCGRCGNVCRSNEQCNTSACRKLDGESCSAGTDCVSGVCTKFYRDVDGDGYGVASDSMGKCTVMDSPSGYSKLPGDCCDIAPDGATKALAAKIHPGAEWQRSKANICGITWDYDCDGQTTVKQGFPSGCVSTTPPCEQKYLPTPPEKCGQQEDYQGDCRICVGTQRPGYPPSCAAISSCPIVEQGDLFECR